MTEHGKTQIQTLAAGFLGFAGVVGLGSLVILHHGGAAMKAPVVVYAPVDAAASANALAAPVSGVKPAAASAAAAAAVSNPSISSPAPLLSAEDRVDAAAPAAPNAAGAAAPKLAVSRHLTAESGGSVAASESAAPAAKPKTAALAKKAFVAPKLDLSKTSAIASTVHYSVSSRAELMGRAAGPVYNFNGNGAGQKSAQVAADSMGAAGAMQKVDDAQKQLDASDLPAADKATVDLNLSQARQAVGSAPGAPTP